MIPSSLLCVMYVVRELQESYINLVIEAQPCGLLSCYITPSVIDKWLQAVKVLNKSVPFRIDTQSVIHSQSRSTRNYVTWVNFTDQVKFFAHTPIIISGK